MPASDLQFDGATVVKLANVYFDGNVISHTVLLANGAKKTLGLIRPGSYHFNTEAAEIMEVIDGTCRVTLDGAGEARAYSKGTRFDVPGKSGFRIEVADGLCQYVCSFAS